MLAIGSGATGIWPLVGRLITTAAGIGRSRAGQTGLAVVIADFINLDWLRKEAFKAAGFSDPQALEEAARTAARMLGMDGSTVLWPVSKGRQVEPNFFVVNLKTGRAWYLERYTSRKTVIKLLRLLRQRNRWQNTGSNFPGPNVIQKAGGF